MIEINRSSIVIRNVNCRSENYLTFSKYFSVYNEHGFPKYVNSIFTIIGNDVYIPSTINPQLVSKYFPDKRLIYKYKVAPLQYRGVTYNLKTSLYPGLQESAFSFLKQMKTADFSKQRLLRLGTGSGKTCLTIHLAKELNAVPLVIVHKTQLVEQWKKQFLFHSNIDEDKIVVLTGTSAILKAKRDAEVYITTHQTLNSVMKNEKLNLDTIMRELGIGLRVFDEAHRNTENMCKINSTSNVEYTLYLTATPSKSKLFEDKVYQRLIGNVKFFDGKFVKEVETKNQTDEEKDKRYINVLRFPFSSRPDLNTQRKIIGNHGFASSVWCDWMTSGGRTYFREALLEILDLLEIKTRGVKVVVIMPELALISFAYDIMEEYLGELESIELSTLNGSMSQKEKDSAMKKQYIIATDKMLGDGSDISGLQVVINFHQFRSAVLLEQMIGRLRFIPNTELIYVDVTDRGFKESIKFGNIRHETIKRLAVNDTSSTKELNFIKTGDENEAMKININTNEESQPNIVQPTILSNINQNTNIVANIVEQKENKENITDMMNKMTEVYYANGNGKIKFTGIYGFTTKGKDQKDYATIKFGQNNITSEGSILFCLEQLVEYNYEKAKLANTSICFPKNQFYEFQEIIADIYNIIKSGYGFTPDGKEVANPDYTVSRGWAVLTKQENKKEGKGWEGYHICLSTSTTAYENGVFVPSVDIRLKSAEKPEYTPIVSSLTLKMFKSFALTIRDINPVTLWAIAAASAKVNNAAYVAPTETSNGYVAEQSNNQSQHIAPPSAVVQPGMPPQPGMGAMVAQPGMPPMGAQQPVAQPVVQQPITQPVAQPVVQQPVMDTPLTVPTNLVQPAFAQPQASYKEPEENTETVTPTTVTPTFTPDTGEALGKLDVDDVEKIFNPKKAKK